MVNKIFLQEVFLQWVLNLKNVNVKRDLIPVYTVIFMKKINLNPYLSKKFNSYLSKEKQKMHVVIII